MTRALAIVCMLLLLRLSLTAGDFACANHGDHPVRSGQMAMDGGSMQHHAGPAVHGAPQDECSTPVTPECCTAMASCGAVFLEGVMADHFVLTQPTNGPAADLLIATTGATGPETPPPRA